MESCWLVFEQHFLFRYFKKIVFVREIRPNLRQAFFGTTGMSRLRSFLP